MILSILNKPLPVVCFSVYSVLKSFLVGVFVALFLIIFEPFHISIWQTPDKTLKLLGFGLISFVVPVFYSAVFSFFVSKSSAQDRWNVGKEIISVTCVLVLIAIGNMFYGNLIRIVNISLTSFVYALISVLIIGIFPITFQVLTRHNRLFKKNVAQAEIINQHLQPIVTAQEEEAEMTESDITIVAENGKDKVELSPADLLYIESADNYSNIVFTEVEKLKRQLLRSSLKRIESQLSNEWILRCHRTYIVNLKNVIKVEGNAAGYKLSLGFNTDPIPVSRNFGPLIIEKMKALAA